jgi:hypothetical protein
LPDEFPKDAWCIAIGLTIKYFLSFVEPGEATGGDVQLRVYPEAKKKQQNDQQQEFMG